MTKAMNKQTILSTVLGVALLTFTAACNNDNNPTDDGRVDVAQGIEFKVDFADLLFAIIHFLYL